MRRDRCRSNSWATAPSSVASSSVIADPCPQKVNRADQHRLVGLEPVFPNANIPRDQVRAVADHVSGEAQAGRSMVRQLLEVRRDDDGGWLALTTTTPRGETVTAYL